MSRLTLLLLGPPRLERDGSPLEFETRKAIALLAFLALSGERHNRDELAALLWPDYGQEQARAYLRYTLWALKKTIGETWLEIDREQIGLAHGDGLWLDVAHFQKGLAARRTHGHPADNVCSACLPVLAEAVALYRGELLAGFTLTDSPGFDDWQFFQRESLQRELAGALRCLVLGQSARGEYEQAIAYARRWLALDRLHEAAHRWLMRLYAWAGQEAAALRQYQECAQLLDEELGVSPEEATSELYNAIKARHAPSPPKLVEAPERLTPPPPPFLEWPAVPLEAEETTFVARQAELARLGEFLDLALAGQGRVVFVTGEAGGGKTALLREFARRAHLATAELLVTSGYCNAQTGLGDPYLPFRQILRQLMSDIELEPAGRVLHPAHLHRLWNSAVVAIRALVEHGSNLINTFVSGQTLRNHITALAPEKADWLEKLDQLITDQAGGHSGLGENDLHEQFVNVLQATARQKPLLLLLDDLHWADAASSSLLFHLGRRVQDSRILLIGAFRPDDVALGRGGERHPLEPVVNELKRHYGEVEVNLDQAQGREFVEAWLDSQPNELRAAFRATLYRHTQGQPLFTVELMRAMQERGEVIRDENGHWVEGPALVWGRLPARTEAVIEERVARLAEPLREALVIASVEGETFTAQVIARLQGLQERNVLQLLSRELEKRHRLVRKQAEVRLNHRMLTRFQFAHALFQQYLYNQLSISERQLLHGEIAEALAELYKGRIEEVTVQLAHHFAEAGNGERAVEYLLKAGDQARGLYAHQEAIAAYQRALSFLKEMGEYERAARTLMKLGLTYHLAFDFRQADQAYKEGFALWQRAGETRLASQLSAPHALRLDWEDPPTLDPTMVAEIISAEIIGHLFSGLVALTPELDVVPELARSWEVLNNGCTYVFHLRNDVRWSDGTAVTAGDFVYAWRRALNPATGSLNASLLHDVKGARAFHQGQVSNPDQVGVHALDEVTLVVDLEGPTSYFLQLLTHYASYPVPSHAIEMHGQSWTKMEHLVTNGPFRLEAWQRRKSMILSRNPQYHSQFTGNVQQVEMSLLRPMEWSTSLALYEADKLDVMSLVDFPLPDMDRARQRHAGEYVSAPRLLTANVGFDVSQPPFDDIRVRRAFVLAADRQALADLVPRGYVSPGIGGFIPPGMPGHSANIGLPFDPDQARQLLAEAGYAGGNGFPAIDARGSAEPDDDIFMEYLRAQWRDILGVEIRWMTIEYEMFVDMLGRGEPPPMFFDSFLADYPDPDNFVRWYRFVVAQRNEYYTRLMENARRVTDQEERLILYRQADRMLVEEAAIMPLYYWRDHMLVKPWVSKFPTSALKLWFLKDVVIEPHG